jgi:hypothetical protein
VMMAGRGGGRVGSLWARRGWLRGGCGSGGWRGAGGSAIGMLVSGLDGRGWMHGGDMEVRFLPAT